MKKILIFGTGFIAQNLVQYFNAKDVECIILYNNHKIETPFEVKQYSMNDDIENIFKVEKPEYVVILHGNSFVPSNVDIAKSINDNLLKATNFLDTIYKKKIGANLNKIIVVGSASEYGKFYDKPISEDFALHPTSIYGLSKIFLFNMSQYFIERGLPIVYVRQFNTVGIGQRDSFVLTSFIKNIALIEKGKLIPELNVGDLSQERDFLDIRDTCAIYDMLLSKGNIGEVYNIASGEFISINTLLNKVIELSNLNSSEIKVNSEIDLFSKEDSLSKRLQADIQKIMNLGFKKKYTIEDTITYTLNYWRNNV